MRKRGDGIDTLLAIPIADDVPPPPPDLSYVRKYPTLIRSLTNLSKPNMDEAAEGARAPPSIQYQNNTLYSDLIQLEQDFLRRKSERLFEGISLYIIKSPKDLPGGERDLAVQAFESRGGTVCNLIEDCDYLLVDPEHMDPNLSSDISTSMYWQPCVRLSSPYKQADFPGVENRAAAQFLLVLEDKWRGSSKRARLTVLKWSWISECVKSNKILRKREGWAMCRIAIDPLRSLKSPAPKAVDEPALRDRDDPPHLLHDQRNDLDRKAKFMLARSDPSLRDLFAGVHAHVVCGSTRDARACERRIGSTVMAFGGANHTLHDFDLATHICVDADWLDPDYLPDRDYPVIHETLVQPDQKYATIPISSVPNSAAARVILTLLDRIIRYRPYRKEEDIHVVTWDWPVACVEAGRLLGDEDVRNGRSWGGTKIDIAKLRMAVERDADRFEREKPSRWNPSTAASPSGRATQDFDDFSIPEPSDLNRYLFAGIAVHAVVGNRSNCVEIAVNLGQTINNHGGKAYAIGAFELATHLLVDSYYCDPDYYPTGDRMAFENTLIKPDIRYLRAPFPSIANKAAARLILTLVDRMLRYNPTRREEDIVVLTFDWPSKCLLSSRLLMEDDKIGSRSWGNCRIDVSALRAAAAEVALVRTELTFASSSGGDGLRSLSGSNLVPVASDRWKGTSPRDIPDTQSQDDRALMRVQSAAVTLVRSDGRATPPISHVSRSADQAGSGPSGGMKRKRSRLGAPGECPCGYTSDGSGSCGDEPAEGYAEKRRRKVEETSYREVSPPRPHASDRCVTRSGFRGVTSGWRTVSQPQTSEAIDSSAAPSPGPGHAMPVQLTTGPSAWFREPLRMDLPGSLDMADAGDVGSLSHGGSISPDSEGSNTPPWLNQGLQRLDPAYSLPSGVDIDPTKMSVIYLQEILPYTGDARDEVPLIGDGSYDTPIYPLANSWDYSSAVRLNKVTKRTAPSVSCLDGQNAIVMAPASSGMTVDGYIRNVLQISLGGCDVPRGAHLQALEVDRGKLSADIIRDLRVGTVKYEVPLIFSRKPVILRAVCLSAANASRFDRRFAFYLRGGKRSEAAALFDAIQHMQPISDRTCLEYYLYSRNRLYPAVGQSANVAITEASGDQYDGDSDSSYASESEVMAGQREAPAAVDVAARRVTAPLPRKAVSQPKLRPGKAVKRKVVHRVEDNDTDSQSDSSLSSCSSGGQTGPLQRVVNVLAQENRAIATAIARKPPAPPSVPASPAPAPRSRAVSAVITARPARRVADGIRRQRLIVHPSDEERDDIQQMDARLPDVGAGDEPLDEQSAETFSKFAYCHWDISWPELAQKYLLHNSSSTRSGASLLNHYSANSKSIHDSFSYLRDREHKHSMAIRVPPITKCPGCGGGAVELVSYSTSGSGRREKLCASCIADFEDERPLGDRAIKQFFVDRRSKVAEYVKALSARSL